MDQKKNKPNPPAQQNKSVTNKQTQNTVAVKQETHHSIEAFSGPMPHPAILRQYEDLIPGSAERIFAMAEKQSNHRQVLESYVVKWDVVRANAGVLFAFILGMTALVGGAYVALRQPLAGSVISVSGLGGIISTFIYGTNSRKQERIEKAKLMKED